MDFSVIDFAGLAAFLTSVGSVIGALKANSNASKAKDDAAAIVSAREQAKKERDREIENLKSEVKLLQHENKEVRERLSEGNGHFVRLEGEVKETNGLLREIIGALRNSGFVISKSPKLSRDSGLEL